METVQTRTSIVSILWMLVGATLCGALGMFAMSVQAHKVLPDSILGSVVRADGGIDLRRRGYLGWQRLGVGESLYPDDMVATDGSEAVLNLEQGRTLTIYPHSTLNIVAVGRQGGKHDIQIVLTGGWLKASQAKTCKPCGVLIIVAGDESYEVKRGKTIGVHLPDSGKPEEFDPADRTFELPPTEPTLSLYHLNDKSPAYHIVASEDRIFGREWWTDRSSREIAAAPLALPLSPPRDRPPVRMWKPFIEIWGNDGMAPRHWINASKSLRPTLQVRVADLLRWASQSEASGVRRYTFHMRGGAETTRPNGMITRTLQAGAPTYSLVTLGDVAESKTSGGLLVGLDQLRPGKGSSWFPAKEWIDPDKATFQIWLPTGRPLGSIGRLVRGADRVGWVHDDLAVDRVGLVLLRRGEIVSLLTGENLDRNDVALLRQTLRADTVVQAAIQDFVLGSTAEIAAKIWQPLAAGTSFYTASRGRVKLLEKRRFPTQRSLENFLQSTGSAVLKREVLPSAL